MKTFKSYLRRKSIFGKYQSKGVYCCLEEAKIYISVDHGIRYLILSYTVVSAEANEGSMPKKKKLGVHESQIEVNHFGYQ